jgi:hypothetical protein
MPLLDAIQRNAICSVKQPSDTAHGPTTLITEPCRPGVTTIYLQELITVKRDFWHPTLNSTSLASTAKSDLS